jgi:hypothetical protein
MDVVEQYDIAFRRGAEVRLVVHHSAVHQQQVFVFAVADDATQTHVAEFPVMADPLEVRHVNIQQFEQIAGTAGVNVFLRDLRDRCGDGGAGRFGKRSSSRFDNLVFLDGRVGELIDVEIENVVERVFLGGNAFNFFRESGFVGRRQFLRRVLAGRVRCHAEKCADNECDNKLGGACSHLHPCVRNQPGAESFSTNSAVVRSDSGRQTETTFLGYQQAAGIALEGQLCGISLQDQLRIWRDSDLTRQ